MQPFFSVIIPTFNRSGTIPQTLLSVKNQTFQNFECIVVDDGSSDTAQLINAVASLDDPRFRVIVRENGGGGAARNTGIDESTGEYIAFLDSDDIFFPEKLEIVNKSLLAGPHCALYSYASVDRGVPGRSWQRPDRPIRASESMASYLFIANQFVQTSTIVIRTDLAKSIRFNPSLRKGQDLDFCLRLDSAGVRFHMIEQPLITWFDASEVGRTSRHAGARAPTDWLESHSHLMSHKEVLGYKATVLAYYQPKYKIFSVLKDLLIGAVVAGVPTKVALRQLLRFALPRHLYRGLVRIALQSLGRRELSKGGVSNAR
ncbi:MAG: glycosyltransferase family A protein [Stenotrophomonas sp.]|uniref:glycosyltransferase family 2 protein n=1 Tax=Stenotrophomonas TaxID=40323 RepID=UPI0015FE6239|nr:MULTISPECIES: glycosyltransferase family A protein [Stenotrophomonas]MDX3930649.1 glycosyltransferase family A protein [Stenotrophomonas sp.]